MIINKILDKVHDGRFTREVSFCHSLRVWQTDGVLIAKPRLRSCSAVKTTTAIASICYNRTTGTQDSAAKVHWVLTFDVWPWKPFQQRPLTWWIFSHWNPSGH